MAVDETLLESAADHGLSSFRWYQWSEPTISIGHFQKTLEPELVDRLGKLPYVRRISGGGAILHHHELTYSLAIAQTHPLAANPRELYDRIHDVVISALHQWGVDCHPRGDTISDRDKEFLCFSRGDSFDVVLGGYKILGSAQRRRRGAVLQHGSLLLAASPLTPEFPGIAELSQAAIELDKLQQQLITDLFGFFNGSGAAISPSKLTAEETARIVELAAMKSIG